jgi:hypothetical protein
MPMDLNAVLAKTAKGEEEIATRKYKLDMRMRALLIMVNGKSTAAELQQKFGQMDDITVRLDQLIAGGYIAATGGAPARAAAPAATPGPSAGFEAARAQLSRIVSDTLGPAAEGICIKLEECESAQELKNFLDTRRATLEAAFGRRGAPFWAKAKELLG